MTQVDPFLDPFVLNDPLFGAPSELADLLSAQLPVNAYRSAPWQQFPFSYEPSPAQIAFPFADRPRQAFLPQNESNVKSLTRAYQDPNYLEFLQTLDPSVRNSLLRYELERVQRGSSPLTSKERLKAGLAAQSGEAITKEPDRNPLNIPVNAFKDLTAIVSSVPKIPAALIEEVRELPQIPERIAEAQAQGDNIVEAVARAPGIRMLPGAYTIGNLAGGGEGIETAVSHPLMTVLDLLPAAKAAGLGERLAATTLGQTTSAARDAIMANLRATRGGQLAQTMWGSQSKRGSILANTITHQVRMALDPKFDRAITAHLDDGIAKEAVGWAQRWQDQVTPERARELTDLAQDPRWAERVTDPAEIQMLHDYQAVESRISQQAVDLELMARIDLDGAMEYVSPKVADRVLRKRAKLDTARRFAEVRAAVRTSITPDELAVLWREQVRPFVTDNRIALRQRDMLLRGLRTAAQEGGYRTPKVGRLSARALEDTVQAWDDWVPEAGRPMNTQQLRARDGWLRDTRDYTQTKIDKAAQRAQTAERDALLTGRWKGFLDEQIRERASGNLAVAEDIAPELVESYLRNGRWSEMVRAGLINSKDLSTWVREARDTMVELRNAGHEPLFVHRVRPGGEVGINNPNPFHGLGEGRVGNPSQTKARSFDSGAYVHDLGVALSHQALEWVNRRAATHFLTEMLRTTAKEGETVAPFARTYDDLVRQYAGVGRARTGVDPLADPAEAIRRRINKEWERFDPKRLPEDIRTDLGFTKNFPEAEMPYLPRPVMRNLRWLVEPPELGKVFDLPMAAFRTSVVALSPRAQVNNLIGGMLMLTAETGPGAWAKFRPALDLMRRVHAGEAVEDLSATFRNTFGSTSRELLEMNDAARVQFAAGTKLAELWNQFQQSAPRRGLRTVIEKSLGLNAFFDDLYRTTAYLYGHDKALVKGMTKEAAQAAGETLARKTLMSWDSMTPFERTIMRSIFPFYNFANHLIRYVSRYPADHPLRSAVVSTIARNELDDLGTGLPQSFLNSFFLGHPDKDGHVTSINIGGMNPFRDAANYMTLTGFLSGVNPLFQTVLNLAGVEPSRPGTNLYPNLRYDPESGRLTDSAPNPLSTLLTNVVPQAGILTGLLDSSSEMQELFRFDPATGMRFLASTSGVPVLWRDLSVHEEQFKAELRRDEAMSRVLSDALRTGDWTTAATYPQLRPVLGQVQVLQGQSAEKYARLNPQTIQQLQNTLAQRFAS